MISQPNVQLFDFQEQSCLVLFSKNEVPFSISHFPFLMFKVFELICSFQETMMELWKKKNVFRRFRKLIFGTKPNPTSH